MPAITYDNFNKGLDLRKGASVADKNSLQELTNGYVTKGGALQSRAGTVYQGRLNDQVSNTHGLFSLGGKLYTFYQPSIDNYPAFPGALIHRNIENYFAYGNGAVEGITKVLQAEVFAGYTYVVTRHTSGKIIHQYLDVDETPDRQDSTVYSAAPSETGIAGHTGIPAGDKVKVYDYKYVAVNSGTSAASPVTFNPQSHANTTDGTVEWRAYGQVVDDVNCPHGEQFVILASRVFSLPGNVSAGEGEYVRYSAVGNARDWSTANDAGFLAVGRNSNGSSRPTALGVYRGDLVVFFEDSAQVWFVDEDPANMRLKQIIDSVGTTYPESIQNVSGDLFFRSVSGYKSISLLSYTDSLIDVDIGAAIDPIVDNSIDVDTSIYYSAGGQYICAHGDDLHVYTFSRTSKISAWSTWTYFYGGASYFTEHQGDLYFRRGDEYWKFDSESVIDEGNAGGGHPFTMKLRFPLLDFKKPGMDKQIFSMDMAGKGQCNVSFEYIDVGHNTGINAIEETASFLIRDVTYSGRNIPVEMLAAQMAPVFESVAGQSFRLDAFTFYYEHNTLT